MRRRFQVFSRRLREVFKNPSENLIPSAFSINLQIGTSSQSANSSSHSHLLGKMLSKGKEEDDHHQGERDTRTILPQDTILEILSRLPVKSILRFRSVSKHWFALLTNPSFISQHLNHSAQDHSLIVHSERVSYNHNHVISLLQIQNPNLISNLDHPYPDFHEKMCVIGSCNGLICLTNPDRAYLMYIWNPATRKYKLVVNTVRNALEFGPWSSLASGFASCGFGFDPIADDYKILMIVEVEGNNSNQSSSSRVELYSCNANSWSVIEFDRSFRVFSNVCDVIANGVPYWLGCSLKTDGGFAHDLVVVSFIMQTGVFDKVSLPNIVHQDKTLWRIVNYRESLAFVDYCSGEESNKNLTVWVMEDGPGGMKSWTKKFSIGPIFKVDQFWCCMNGDIIVENAEKEMFLYNPETKQSKHIQSNAIHLEAPQVHNYRESLVWVKGFAPVIKHKIWTPGRQKYGF